MSTPFHARYFAHELTLQRRGGVERLSASLFNATVDLNPHQIDAALFALRSPLSKGALLADEVGLGKTIEAALVLCQFWAERRRRLLVICPASIRKQWAAELESKFNVPAIVMDTVEHKRAIAAGRDKPFLAPAVIITSLHFASAMKDSVRAVPWDLVVLDEAHKLRNAYKPNNRMGQRLRWALEDRRKLLLTATPLQNSLAELYGLAGLIDENIFGDFDFFRSQYMRQDSDLADLRKRLSTFCTRTLRSQVAEFVQYTARWAITRPFNPTDDEHAFYEAVSEFLSREDTLSVPKAQRALTTLVLRKLLASSSHAIAATLTAMKERLEKIREGLPDPGIVEQVAEDEALDDESLDELLDLPAEEIRAEPAERERLNAEIAHLDVLASWAVSIGTDTKSRALLLALETGFGEMARTGARRRALVFTESRRTQQHLGAFLEANGYAGKVVLFDGSNNGPAASAIYEKWVRDNAGTGRVSGSRAVDIRAALLDQFEHSAEIMVATEAAAEGVNLQFCSLVINYDLPWNPQRIEQRIGRCHRYGQKYDVVVINFLNERNEADRRVLELLQDKFHLFDGVFGASDEVLGALESGVDFEKRILAICQSCRTPEEIETAFNAVRRELDESIARRLADTQRAIIEHLDEDVHARLKRLDSTREQLDQVGRIFWALSRYILRDHATFDDGALTFELHTPPQPAFRPARYTLISRGQENVAGDLLFRLTHPLGEFVIEHGRECPAPVAEVVFDYSHHGTRLAAVEALRGRAGWLMLQKLGIDCFDREEHLLFSAFTDDGTAVDQETCERLFRCAGTVGPAEPSLAVLTRLKADGQRHVEAAIANALDANGKLFQAERERLERWAQDMVDSAEHALDDVKAQIKAISRQLRAAPTLEEQHALQVKLRELEKSQRTQRQRIFDVEDEIRAKRDVLIDRLEKQLAQKTDTTQLFTMRWRVV